MPLEAAAAAVWGEEWDHTDSQIMHASHLNQLPSPLSTLKPALTVEGREQKGLVFFLFNLAPLHWLGLFLGVDSSLAGVRAGREEAKGQERKLEMG